MARNYDLVFVEGATEIFGEELLEYMAMSSEKNSLEMEYKLIQKLNYLNWKYRNTENCSSKKRKQFLKLYRIGIVLLLEFYESDGISANTIEELAYHLLKYETYGRCNTNFVQEAFRNILEMNEDIKLF